MSRDSTALARAVVVELIRAGVRDVVIAPGSRNAPLSFAAFDAAEAGLVRLHTRIDERTAAFLALGLAKGHRPAAVVCTSGTAAANLHPAMLEARHAGVPLVAVTADRPLRLRGTSANQTTDQSHLFPGVSSHDLSSVDQVPELTIARAPFATPTHLNVCLDAPLLPSTKWRDLHLEVAKSAPRGGEICTPWWRQPMDRTEIPSGPRTVVVAGDDAGPPARFLAQDANWPLFAEPSSGARTGSQAIGTYRLLLASELGRQIERVIVYGHPTLSRPIARLLERGDVEVLAAAPPGAGLPHPFPVAATAPGWSAGRDDSGWFESWQAADRERARAIGELLAGEPDLTPYDVAGAVSAALPAGGLLVVGASNPIRDLDLTMAPIAPGEHRKVVANRGLAGIDGTISTAIGSALARDSSRTLALMGDVTFVHDANGLALGPGQPTPDLTIVVVNDDGGSIFATLEQGAADHADRFEALFGTPHGTDLASLCAAHRIPHWRIDGRGNRASARAELDHALGSPAGGIEVIEVVCRRDNRRELDERIREV